MWCFQFYSRSSRFMISGTPVNNDNPFNSIVDLPVQAVAQTAKKKRTFNSIVDLQNLYAELEKLASELHVFQFYSRSSSYLEVYIDV